MPPRVVPATKADGQVAPYADMGRYKKKGKKKASVVSIIAAVVILAAIGVGVYLYLNPLQFNVTVNGMTRTVDRGTTLNDMIAEADPSPRSRATCSPSTGRCWKRAAAPPSPARSTAAR